MKVRVISFVTKVSYFKNILLETANIMCQGQISFSSRPKVGYFFVDLIKMMDESSAITKELTGWDSALATG